MKDPYTKLYLTVILGGLVFIAMLAPALNHEVHYITGESVQIQEEAEVAYEEVKIENTTPIRTSLGMFSVSAYCDCAKCQGKWVGQTATGEPLKAEHTIAVDPKVIPLGTVVYIDGLGYRTAEDTGGAIKGNKIDLFMSSHEEACKWGRKELEVFIDENL